ncbi:MAG: type II toxin-antitoxin system VapC family toxin [Acidobacteriota bacterium]|nr:type II toxin-antitoxin system VapC family toxin [Acidobacteriota bacterium]
MILDSSAILAILFEEPGSETLLEKIVSSAAVGVGAPTLTETVIVCSARLGRDARSLVMRFVAEAAVETIPLGEAHLGTAVDAWLRYGRGRHPAALNFGDCLSYAASKVSRRPLLFSGEHFKKTDVDPA